MSGLVLVAVVPMTLLSYILGAIAQGGTNATCSSGYEWMANSEGQSPCLVSSWLFTPCSSPADSFVYPLGPGQHYNTPLNNTQSATPCRCNTVLFSTIAACATCQGMADFIDPWLLYSQNCSTTYITKYPENIPSGTAVPAWAYLDVTANNTFDPAAAEAVAAQNLPESTALPVSSTTSESSASTLASPSTTANANTGTSTGGSSGPGPKKSNAGPIAGGVVGGIAGLTLLGLTVFFVLRYRRDSAAASSGHRGHRPKLGPYTDYGAGTHTWEKSPATSVSTHRFYDPNDPRTFPAQDPYARGPGQASIGYLSADASAAVVNTSFADGGHRGGGVTTQNPYRGAPEV